MLDAGHKGIWNRKIIVFSLVAFYKCFCYFAAEVGILSRTFSNSSPAGIAAEVDHRAENPVYTIDACFLS